MKTFKQLQEMSKKECGIKYGKILFGEFRGLEDDTEYEADVFRGLSKYIRDGFRTPKFIHALKELKTCKTIFKKELQPKENRTIFRGLGEKITPYGKLTFEKTKDLYEVGGFDYFVDNGDFFWFGYEGLYKPKFRVEGWSDREFSYFIKEEPHFIIWEIPVNHKDLLFDSEFLNKVGKQFDYIDEYEILRVSKAPVKGIRWEFWSKYNIYTEYQNIITKKNMYGQKPPYKVFSKNNRVYLQVTDEDM